MSPDRSAVLSLSRIEKARHELEAAVAALERAIEKGPAGTAPLLRHALSAAVRSLERTTTALRRVLDALPPDEIAQAHARVALTAGLSEAASLLASRMMLARAWAKERPPSIAARVLAALLEEPDRDLDAGSVAERIGCTPAVARTTLHRLVASAHAERTAPGRFRAKSSQ